MLNYILLSNPPTSSLSIPLLNTNRRIDLTTKLSEMNAIKYSSSLSDGYGILFGITAPITRQRQHLHRCKVY